MNEPPTPPTSATGTTARQPKRLGDQLPATCRTLIEDNVLSPASTPGVAPGQPVHVQWRCGAEETATYGPRSATVGTKGRPMCA